MKDLDTETIITLHGDDWYDRAQWQCVSCQAIADDRIMYDCNEKCRCCGGKMELHSIAKIEP